MRIEYAHGKPVTSSRTARKKRPVNVTIRTDLIDEARNFGTNISAVLEKAIIEEHARKRREQWREENRVAIKEANDELAANGLWSDGLRLF